MTSENWKIIITVLMCLTGYFIGNIVFGSIISKTFKKDVRRTGSGNIGATNVSRSLGLKIGILVMLLDALKAYLVVLITVILLQIISAKPFDDKEKIPLLIYLPGFFVILGHCYPIQYLVGLIKKDKDIKLKSGGKGVSSAFGLLMAFSPFIGVLFASIWTIITLSTKYVCLGSILSALIISFFVFIPYLNMAYMAYMFDNDGSIFQFNSLLDQGILCLLLILNFILILFRHKGNIIRLINKNENKIFTKHK